MRLFCFGAGYSAKAALRRLAPDLETAWGTTRSADQSGAIADFGAEPLVWSGSGMDEKVRESLSGATHVLVSIGPGEDGDRVLATWQSLLAELQPEAICYLSTVGVYGDHDGAWVDETTPCRPVSKRSRHRLAAEKVWTDFGQKTATPVSIIRLAGIYGPGRGPFAKLRAGTSRRIIKPGQVFNRIHADDIAQIVAAALKQSAKGIFNGTDDEPAPPQDVITFAAGLLGMEPPPEIAFEDAEMTAMARTFYGESKRVRNDRIKRELGVELLYPTYREGLPAILSAEG